MHATNRHVTERTAEHLALVTTATVGHALALLGLWVFLVFILPHYEAAAGGAGAALPRVTRVVFGVSAWMRTYWYLGLAGTGAFIAVDAVVFYALRRSGSRAAAWLWSILVLLVLAGMVATTLVGFFSVLSGLVEQVQQ